MESNRFFVVIQRINSVLFLLLLLGGALLMLVAAWQSSHSRWQRDAIQVAPEQAEQKPIEFVIGDVARVRGFDVRYVELNAREEHSGLKYSSGSSTTTRNLLFLLGKEMTPHWLFETHQQLIHSYQPLYVEDDEEDKKPAVAFYYDVLKADTNGDGEITDEDQHTIALSRTDGSGYQEIESGHRRVVEQQVTDDGATLLLMVEERGQVVIKRYSLKTFQKDSERNIAILASPS
ncbi:MAG TPA: hypothetical protein VGE50_02405 [Gammaproteobacteria bacterium]